MLFQNRQEAGQKLAGKLAQYQGGQPLLLAVPRGGVAVALPIWRRLGGELDLHITCKIGAPMQPELAIGAVSGNGYLMLNEPLVSRLQVAQSYIEHAAQEARREIARRLSLYRSGRPAVEVNGRLVILVDDGVATGFTLLAALRELKSRQPLKLVLAVPVGPPDTLAMLARETDKLVSCASPPHFAAVGQFYRRFEQLSDSQVLAVLKEAWAETGS